MTTPRTMVQYVATEYGVVNLKYKSTRERARALISIAHPDFRRELGAADAVINHPPVGQASDRGMVVKKVKVLHRRV